MRFKPIFATLVAVLSLAGLSACGSSDSPAGAFNSADVSFAQDMIPHHRQATEMAELAADRTQNGQVLGLATKIIAAQQPEIDTMSGWLESWDKKVPSESSGMSGMNHGGNDMPGMMSDDQMSSLEAASGEQFDEMFLTMMIAHHEGAIEMAEKEETEGRFGDAVDLAKKIQTDQAAEISTMKSLLI